MGRAVFPETHGGLGCPAGDRVGASRDSGSVGRGEHLHFERHYFF